MKGLGIFAIVVGIGWMIFALSMDVSVSTGMGRVNNLGLMADRQLHTIVGGMIALAGLLMLLFGGNVLALPASMPTQMDTRPCPLCAETIKCAAIKCKHCGAEFAAVPTPLHVEGRITSPGEAQNHSQQAWALTIPCRKDSDRERATTTADLLGLPSLPTTDAFLRYGPYHSKTEAGEVLRRLTEKGVHGNIEEIRRP